jgi:hypothetical protein
MSKLNYEFSEFLAGCEECLESPFGIPCVEAAGRVTEEDPKSDRDLYRNIGFWARQACPHRNQEFSKRVIDNLSETVVEVRQIEKYGKTVEVEL